jgi:hypothetical protein
MTVHILCDTCVANGCYPDVCRCSCHPAPIGLRAKLRKLFGVTRMMPGSKHWDPNAKFVSRTSLHLADLELRYANLLAASRATIAADHDGEANPLAYLRDELDAHGQLPDATMHPAQLLALAVMA